MDLDGEEFFPFVHDVQVGIGRTLIGRDMSPANKSPGMYKPIGLSTRITITAHQK